jgi:hypothetical protein
MGKRSARRLRFPAAALALLACAGCATVFLSPQTAEIKREIALAESLAGRGLYPEAISACERAIAKSAGNPSREEALFKLGSLYAAAENPDRDFARSLACLQGLVKEFPKGRRTSESRPWVGVLEELLALEAELKDRTAEFAADQGVKAKRLKELEGQLQAQKAAVEALQQQMKKMKEIDIESEKKTKVIK